MKDIIRSILYMSCLNLNNSSSEKLAMLPMDMLLLDLEDSVPLSEKNNARENLLKYFMHLQKHLKKVSLRINSVQTVNGLKDLLFLGENSLNLDMLLVPMVEEQQEIVFVKKVMQEYNLNPKVFSLIETPKGVENVINIGSMSDGLCYGGADYCSIIGIDISKQNSLIDYVTSKIINAAAINSIPAYDTPCFIMNDLDYLEKESKMAYKQGFVGKQAIHPQQLEIINSSFSQPKERTEWALHVLRATQQVNGRIAKASNTMVGPPFTKLAEKILSYPCN